MNASADATASLWAPLLGGSVGLSMLWKKMLLKMMRLGSGTLPLPPELGVAAHIRRAAARSVAMAHSAQDLAFMALVHPQAGQQGDGLEAAA